MDVINLNLFFSIKKVEGDMQKIVVINYALVLENGKQDILP